ncbi:MAG: ubiquitin-like small modifier protein 1 [Acidobacteriota bacterium]
MSVIIEIPTPLRRFTDNRSQVEIPTQEGHTVEQVLRQVVEAHPSLQRHLYGDDGRLRSFVNVFVGDEDVRHLDGPQTSVADGSRISIIPSIAGGRR